MKQNGYLFMNYENSESSDPHRLLLNILDKKILKRSDKCLFIKS